METLKLESQEYQDLIDLQNREKTLAIDMGLLEIQYQSAKKYYLEELEKLNEDKNKIGQYFYEKYGDGEINLETKEFIKA